MEKKSSRICLLLCCGSSLSKISHIFWYMLMTHDILNDPWYFFDNLSYQHKTRFGCTCYWYKFLVLTSCSCWYTPVEGQKAKPSHYANIRCILLQLHCIWIHYCCNNFQAHFVGSSFPLHSCQYAWKNVCLVFSLSLLNLPLLSLSIHPSQSLYPAPPLLKETRKWKERRKMKKEVCCSLWRIFAPTSMVWAFGV